MAYYTRVLQPDEQVRVVGRLHWMVYVPSWLILIVAAGVLIGSFWVQDTQMQAWVQIGAGIIAVIGLLWMLGIAFRRHGTEIVVTDRRVIYKRGIVSRYTAEMNVSKIETVDVIQGFWARMLNYGTVVIRGTGSGFEPLVGVGDPLALRNAITVG
ncbi:MAG: PH domain-containing protein [Rhodospirillales bacterium]|nr:PH domain-containing protein [Rhodospirillales bacterium]